MSHAYYVYPNGFSAWGIGVRLNNTTPIASTVKVHKADETTKARWYKFVTYVRNKVALEEETARREKAKQLAGLNRR